MALYIEVQLISRVMSEIKYSIPSSNGKIENIGFLKQQAPYPTFVVRTDHLFIYKKGEKRKEKREPNTDRSSHSVWPAFSRTSPAHAPGRVMLEH